MGKDGQRRRQLTHIPVTIADAGAMGDGPYFLQRLSKGRYAVTTRSDAWSFMTPVKIDKARRRVVVEGKV